jgi:D-alanyl-D-alanine carboxypeptidase/D-alanyl-D-alanine-endopeptidase (penicillin-binding protein 4)
MTERRRPHAGSPLAGPRLAPLAVATAVTIGALLGAVRPAGAQSAPKGSPRHSPPSLSQRIDARLDAAPFDRTLWGVAVVDEAGRLLYGRNERRLFVPASNLKLVVSAVAAALLPPDWTVRTSVYSEGAMSGDTLRGDLVLYGRGDPTFGRRCYAVDTTAAGTCEPDAFARLRQLAALLRARGIRAVAGGVVGDGSYFEPPLTHPAWENFDLTWWYAAPVSGLGFHDNSIDFRWQPGSAPGAPAVIAMTPDLGDVTLDNRSVTVPAGGFTDIGNRFYRVPGTLQYWVDGTVALDRPPRTESVAHPDPNLYAAQALRHVLIEAGIAVAGAARSTTDSARYRRLRTTAPLAEVDSRPLRDWIFPILNTSQNWFAEMTLKQLGRRFGGAGSWKAGLAVERRFLIDSAGIDSTEFSLIDGSGLAGNNYISPLALTQLLRYMRRHPRYATFAAGLPVAGARGSLRARFGGTPLAGRVQAKTGSIAGVNTLSGYVQTRSGKTLVFAIQANHHTQRAVTMLAAIDSIVAALHR